MTITYKFLYLKFTLHYRFFIQYRFCIFKNYNLTRKIEHLFHYANNIRLKTCNYPLSYTIPIRPTVHAHTIPQKNTITLFLNSRKSAAVALGRFFDGPNEAISVLAPNGRSISQKERKSRRRSLCAVVRAPRKMQISGQDAPRVRGAIGFARVKSPRSSSITEARTGL